MKYSILTIEREFGTRGYELANVLSERLQIPFYDHGMLRMMLKNFEATGQENVRNYSRRPNSLLYNLANYMNTETGFLYEVEEEVALKEFGMIRRISENGPCIILGRCSNYILKHRQDVYSVFMTGSMEGKQQRISELIGIKDEEEIRKLIHKTDRARAQYYEHYTKHQWGDEKDYNKVLDYRTMKFEEMVAFLEKKFQDKISAGFSNGVSMYR